VSAGGGNVQHWPVSSRSKQADLKAFLNKLKNAYIFDPDDDKASESYHEIRACLFSFLFVRMLK